MLLAVRLSILLAFVIGLPLLAVPSVLQRVTGESERGETAGPRDRWAGADPGAASDGDDSNSVRRGLGTANGPSGPSPSSGPAVGGLSAGRSPADDGRSENLPLAAGDPFPTAADRRRAEAVQKRLQVLGASEYWLEHRPQEAAAYVARCHVDLPLTPALKKRFEVRRATPLAALEAVLGEVEQWHLQVARTRARRVR